jgi:beta-hydroxylase
MPPRPGFLGRLRRARRRHVKRFGKRLIRALGGFLGRQSRIGDAAVFDVACLPALRELERHWHEIRDEVDAELRELDELPALRELSRDQSRIAADPSWKAFVFHGFGFRSELNRSRCPRTSRLLDAVPGLENAWLSILGPRYHVPEHRGITKGMLNCLVGLRVPGPPGASRIRIGSEWRAFAEGRAILFDDTVPHEVWNDAPSERVVLLVSVRRPLRWPGRLLNALFLAAFKRTAYVREAVATFRGWEERRRATLGR